MNAGVFCSQSLRHFKCQLKTSLYACLHSKEQSCQFLTSESRLIPGMKTINIAGVFAVRTRTIRKLLTNSTITFSDRIKFNFCELRVFVASVFANIASTCEELL